MKAWWLDTQESISPEQLRSHGIHYERLDLTNYQSDIDRLKEANGYVAQDVVEITPQTPNLETILAKFDKEHLHTDDEVRFVLDGEGVFDIRSAQDRWMRVKVVAGDYISVPANRHHRFFCTEIHTIRCIRLFKDNSGWTPIYRPQAERVTV